MRAALRRGDPRGEHGGEHGQQNREASGARGTRAGRSPENHCAGSLRAMPTAPSLGSGIRTGGDRTAVHLCLDPCQPAGRPAPMCSLRGAD